MKPKIRFFIGGLGALAPLLLFFINVDFEDYVTNVTALKMAGYIVRSTILFLLGGFIAYLHDTETKKITLFLIGIAAPSLLAGYISTANTSTTKSVTEHDANQNSQSPFQLIPSAFALTRDQQNVTTDVKKFTLPPQSGMGQFVEGLFGVSQRNVWFVIAGSQLKLAEARKQVTLISEKFPAYHADVYAPYADNLYYSVVIGAHLTQSAAKKLCKKAIKSGFKPRPYYKTFQNLPPAQ